MLDTKLLILLSLREACARVEWYVIGNFLHNGMQNCIGPIMLFVPHWPIHILLYVVFLFYFFIFYFYFSEFGIFFVACCYPLPPLAWESLGVYLCDNLITFIGADYT